MLLVLGNPQCSQLSDLYVSSSKYIKFPKTKEEVEELSSLFYAKHGFSNLLAPLTVRMPP